SISAQNVTNNVAAINPVYVSSVIENTTPSRLEMTYNLTLANITPAASAFTVRVNSSARTVSAVTISGTKVLLTLASQVVYGDVVTVAYTKPATNPLQTASGGQAVSISAQSVTNNVAANQPPFINISSPTKSESFIAPATITIDVIAYDPDGSIKKIEFFQGTVKLGELTSAPYSYVWKDVQEGTYSITAAATDNQNLRIVSSAVTVVVEKSSTQINQLPVVGIKISNNKKPKKHDNIVIVAEANDPDGFVTKVELKNGNVTIAEMTIAPYVYTLTDIDTGTYQFTAIATDNFGASSSSQTIELIVDDFYVGNSEIIRLYPNPSEGQFKIDILTDLPEGNSRLSIFNSSGMIICTKKLLKDESPIDINLDGSASGIYVLMITSDKTIITTKKFIINR
ncbi:MAG: T9SS type A sorting domain-containing protein, partial [Bacteroidales bacterium]|nr:T9SS type A sorting domain-containing protein [Bacteroidales bacterium]